MGYQAFRDYHTVTTLTEFQQRQQMFARYWSLYDGSAFTEPTRVSFTPGRKVYANTAELMNAAAAIVDFYHMNVYQGAIPTDIPQSGNRLPGAIPIIAETGSEETDAALLLACVEAAKMWNMQSHMRDRPLKTTIGGSSLTEVIDDLQRAKTWIRTHTPDVLRDVTTDNADNVKSYVLEYPIALDEGGEKKPYLFRKEVDKESFRYYRTATSGDFRPWDMNGPGTAITPNPYGFVPAVFDRHKQGRDMWGQSALASVRQTIERVNSIMSHGLDYQQKKFVAPVLVKGAPLMTAKETTVGPGRLDRPEDHAESLPFMSVGPDGGIEDVNFDVGRTLEFVEKMEQWIYDANPEARFYQQLREMSSITGPGVELAMGDARNKIVMARDNYDPNTVKLFQMAIAIHGYRLANGDWPNAGSRRDAFRPFGLDSFDAGLLDMSIADRPLVPTSEEDRVALWRQYEQLETRFAMERAGLSEEDAQRLLDEKRDFATFNGLAFA